MRPFPRLALLLTAGVFLAAADTPPPSDIVARRGDVQLTTGDIRDALSKADPALRNQVVANPQALTEFVKERMLRQILLKEALAAKWEQNPDAVARVAEARDTAIVQSWLASHAQVEAAYPSDAELSAAYEANKARFVIPPQFHVAQIAFLVPTGATKDADEEAHKKARDIKAQLAKPKADFAEIAKASSQDAASAPKGGDLGWLREDQIKSPVKETIKGLAAGAVSEPVRGADAWHIVKLLETKPQTLVPLDQVKSQLSAALRQARTQQATNAYLADMLKKEPVQINEIGLAAKLAEPK